MQKRGGWRSTLTNPKKKMKGGIHRRKPARVWVKKSANILKEDGSDSRGGGGIQTFIQQTYNEGGKSCFWKKIRRKKAGRVRREKGE